MFKNQSYVNGKWTTGESGKTISIYNPANNVFISNISYLTREEVRKSISFAHQAYLIWKKKTAKERSKYLLAWHSQIKMHSNQLACLLVKEQGKPLKEAQAEIIYAANFVAWFAEEAKRAYGEIIPSHLIDSEIRITKEPVGVCAAITPWNFPSAMITRKAAAALAAGCSIIVKPSELTPFSATALAFLAEKAGIPAGVFNVVLGEAEMTGQEFCGNRFIRKISFTGSAKIGKLLMGQAAPKLKRLSLELGGNAAFLVFAEADLRLAVDQVMLGKFRNSGQTCISINRILVQKSIYAAFVKILKEKISKLRVGEGFCAGVDQGPLINSAAIKKVERHISMLVKAGAKIVLGGKKYSDNKSGNFFEPSLIIDVPPLSILNEEETFGPIAAVIPFETEAEAISIANNTTYGLAAYVATTDLARAHRVANALESGMVGVNHSLIATELAPFGGIKESGVGREGSHLGLDEYLETKYTFFKY